MARINTQVEHLFDELDEMQADQLENENLNFTEEQKVAYRQAVSDCKDLLQGATDND